MILILILSDATYNFEIRFVAMIHYQKMYIGQKTILSVKRLVCWRVSPKSVDPIICPQNDHGIQQKKCVHIEGHNTDLL